MLEPCIVKDAAAITEPRLQRLYEYWNEKRGARRAPLRGDIDPVEIPELLGTDLKAWADRIEIPV